MSKNKRPYQHVRVRHFKKDGKSMSFKDHVFKAFEDAMDFLEDLGDDIVKLFDEDDQPLEFEDRRRHKHHHHGHHGHRHGHRRDDDDDYQYL